MAGYRCTICNAATEQLSATLVQQEQVIECFEDIIGRLVYGGQYNHALVPGYVLQPQYDGQSSGRV